MKKITTILPAAIIALAMAGCADYSETVNAAIEVANTPVLSLKSANHIAALSIENQASAPQTLNSLKVSFSALSDLSDIQAVSVWYKNGIVAESSSEMKGRRGEAGFDLDFALPCGKTDIVLGVKMKDTIELSNKIRIEDVLLETSDGKVKIDCGGTPSLRVGVALRRQWQDGVNTTRIPGITCSKNGTLIAMYDARRDSYRDLQGNIDICYNRSTDGGRTWSPMMVAIDMGEWGGLPQKYNGVSDGSVLADMETGDIYITGLWMHGVIDPYTGKTVENLTEDSKAWNHQWRSYGSQPGYDVKRSSQFVYVKSTDDGLTWSEPVNITRQVKPEEWWLMAPGLGSGITMKDGTLVIPAEGRDETGKQVSTIIYSKDHGDTWQHGNIATTNTNECTVFEREDGSIMLNARERANRGRIEGNGREIAVTSDLGESWTKHPTSRSALIEPSCNGSLLKHKYIDRKGEEHNLVLFFNPSSIYRRNNFTLKCSLDDGETWPKELWLQIDENNGTGYSSLTSIDNDTIGILFEGSGSDVVFMQVKVADILEYTNIPQ